MNFQQIISDREFKVGNIRVQFADNFAEGINQEKCIYIHEYLINTFRYETGVNILEELKWDREVVDGEVYIVSYNSNLFIVLLRYFNEFKYLDEIHLINYYGSHILWFLIDSIIAVYPDSIKEIVSELLLLLKLSVEDLDYLNSVYEGVIN